MKQLEINNRKIGDGHPPYVIAEIGANHCGDFGICRKMVDEAAACGVDAIKLQKRYNDVLFTKKLLEEPYSNEHSYGQTYGEHRQALDWFDCDEFFKIKKQCDFLGIDFICTPFEHKSAKFLSEIGLDAYKIASCDLKNTPLIEQVAGFGKPMIVSTGGGTWDDIKRAVVTLGMSRTDFAIMHCVSIYPNRDEDLNLAVIEEMNTRFGQVIGFSSHHASILPNPIAWHVGARIFEVHFTLNRGWAGTDHGFSMEPSGLKRLCEDLRRIPIMMGNDSRQIVDGEKTGFVRKMGKSIYSAHKINGGSVIKREDLQLKAPADGLPPHQFVRVVGFRAARDIGPETAITDDLITDQTE